MDYIVEVSHLRKVFNAFEAVKDLSFQVEEGEVFGFLGINGAGKSTTINMLSTLIKPTNGMVNIAGYQLGKENDGIRKSIGVVFQSNTLDEKLTIRENLISRAYLYEKDAKKVKANIERVTNILEIKDLMGRRFKELSGGQKRKCEIARALLNMPKLLFLDEPTTGLDPQTRKLVWDSIDKLREETNMTIFLTTHYMEEAVRAKHVAIIDSGNLVAYDTPYILKEKYAKDLLKLASSRKEEVISMLEEKHVRYEQKAERIEVELESAKHAIDLLQQIKPYIDAFEVVQGTLEDAFLNITGKSIKEV